jgi:hypothetical protein
MPRPYEDDLGQYLTRLDRWIDEVKALAANSSDDETLRVANEELTRQVALRDRYERVLRRTKSLNRIARGAIIAFLASFALLFAFALTPFRPERIFVLLLLLFDLLTVFVSAVIFIGVLVIRDIVVTGKRPWRFSL